MPLPGRDFDVAYLDGLLSDVRAGSGRALALVGRAGVGKSALLDQVPALAPDCEILRADGVEAEADLAWAGLATLLAPVVDDDVLAGLAPPRAAALRRVLLLDADDQPVERRAVAVATLDVLTGRARPDRPVAVLVDDLHWLDEESRQVLAFVARRIDADPVALVATSRASDDLPQRTLLDLDPAAADELLRGAGVEAPVVRRRLVAELGTNPLLLTQAARHLDPDVRSGAIPLPPVLPLPDSLTESARQRVADLPPPTRAAILLLASLTRPDRASVNAALGAAGLTLDALAPAEERGVVEVDDARATVTFTHPTLRTAALATATSAERRAAHATLAGVPALGTTARAVHAARAADGPDERVAAELERVAHGQWRAGALTAAAAELERAADLSTSTLAAARRRSLGAEARLALGDIDRATALLERARGDLADLDPDPGEEGALAAARVLVDQLAARALHVAGDDAAATGALLALAQRIEADDPEAAAGTLLEALGPLVRRIDLEGTVQAIGRLAALAPSTRPATQDRIRAVTAAFDCLVTGDTEAVMEATRHLIDREGAVRAGPLVAEVVAPMLSYRDRSPAVLGLLRELEGALREAAALAPLAAVLSAIQFQYHGRDQVVATLAGEEAIELAEELGAPHLALLAAGGLAIAASTTGDRAALDRALAVIALSTEDSARTSALIAEGAFHLAAGDVDRALAIYEELRTELGLGRFMTRWEPEYVEALVRARRREEALQVLEELDTPTIHGDAVPRFDRAWALVTEDEEEAGKLFHRSVEALRAAGDVIGVGRSELCWGERVRRARRPAEARRHLEAAVEMLEAAQATPWAQRARDELAAAGGGPADRTTSTHDLLTTRELRIARLAAAGASNREIGTAVFISERTVEAHLSAVFRKLQVRNRRALAARALEDPALRSPEG